ncbi:serine/arginine repetitive matrix protein 1-like [Symphalangus syndactylus]|uniref:serine/arginine repetitive matrix protein 1-like n=1 Tax=Symphalangus syndactylus TaxID=9590 RepID=UPI0030066C64
MLRKRASPESRPPPSRLESDPASSAGRKPAVAGTYCSPDLRRWSPAPRTRLRPRALGPSLRKLRRSPTLPPTPNRNSRPSPPSACPVPWSRPPPCPGPCAFGGGPPNRSLLV